MSMKQLSIVENAPEPEPPRGALQTWAQSLGVPQTWAQSLSSVVSDDYQGDYEVPSERVPGDTDKILRALVTPEMRSRLTSEQKTALSRVSAAVKRSREDSERSLLSRWSEKRLDEELNLLPASVERELYSDEFGERVATLLVVDEIPLEVVLATVAEAVGRDDYAADREEALLCITAFKNRSVNVDAKPTFDSDEFTRMAEYTLKYFPTLEYFDRSFHRDGAQIDVSELDQIVEVLLRRCRIWDQSRRREVSPNNKILCEVRGSLARNSPRRRESVRRSGEKPLQVRLPDEFVKFAGECLALSPDSWTRSSVILSSWSSWCRDRGTTIGESRVLFKNLVRWSRSAARRSRCRVDGVQTPGYYGVALKWSSL